MLLQQKARSWRDRFGDGKSAILERAARHLPLKKVGSPTEVADLIVAVAASTFMTGTVVGVDGGAALALGAALA
jgi:NAD(P)-dependent dehydrogenase (short-subunit alcohol dehydrogenase family)